MPTAQQLIEFLEEYLDLKQKIDYYIAPGDQGVTVLNLNTLVILVDEFGEEPLKRAKEAGILKLVNGVDFVIDTSRDLSSNRHSAG